MDICPADAAVSNFDFDVGVCEWFRLVGGKCQWAGRIMGDPAGEGFGRC